MLDYVLILLMILTIISSFFIVKTWRKRYYVKELYVDQSMSYVLFPIMLWIIMLTGYIVGSKGWTDSERVRYLLIDFLLLLIPLSTFLIFATTCVYLKDNMIIYRNIFRIKRLLIDKDTKIIRKMTIAIIKSKRKLIILDYQIIDGPVRTFLNKIETIINENE